jgi:hypothetical protein
MKDEKEEWVYLSTTPCWNPFLQRSFSLFVHLREEKREAPDRYGNKQTSDPKERVEWVVDLLFFFILFLNCISSLMVHRYLVARCTFFSASKCRRGWNSFFRAHFSVEWNGSGPVVHFPFPKTQNNLTPVPCLFLSCAAANVFCLSWVGRHQLCSLKCFSFPFSFALPGVTSPPRHSAQTPTNYPRWTDLIQRLIIRGKE